MGSLFKTATPSYVPVSYQPYKKTTVVSPSLTGDTNNVEDSESNQKEKVKKAVRKSARGRDSTIQTSYRGILTQSTNSLSPQRKNLLGE